MNPHFLFNTLNTLYGLVITRSDKAEPAMERFINLTKYMYNNTNSDFISLREEVDYIEQYIGLQKLRLNDFAKVDFVHHHLCRECLQVRYLVGGVMLHQYQAETEWWQRGVRG